MKDTEVMEGNPPSGSCLRYKRVSIKKNAEGWNKLAYVTFNLIALLASAYLCNFCIF